MALHIGRTKNLRGIKAKGRAHSNKVFWEDICYAYRISLLKAKDDKGGKVRHLETDPHSYRADEKAELAGFKATTFEL